MTLTDTQTADLQLATMGQSYSENLLKQRHGRITARNFHRVYTRMNTLKAKPSADPKPLIWTLVGYSPEPVSNYTPKGDGTTFQKRIQVNYFCWT